MQVGAISTIESTGRNHSNLNYSLPLHAYSCKESLGLAETIREVWKTMKGELGKRDRKVHREHISALVVNLFVAWRTKGNPFLAVHLGKSRYAKGERLHSIYLKYRPMMWALDQLLNAGFIEGHTGIHYPGCSKCTRIRATLDLVDMFIRNRLKLIHFSREEHDSIELRAEKHDQDKGRVIDISRGRLAQQAKSMRERVNALNDFIVKHNFRLVIDEETFIEHYIRGRANKRNPCTPPNPLAIKLRRIFNVSFEYGGRFYGIWIQNIPGALRKSITINGVPVQEVDFKSLHPTILYIEEGAPMGGDPYIIPGYGQSFRDLMKVFFLIMFNAKSDMDAIEGVRGEIWSNSKLFGRYRDCMTNGWLYKALEDIKRHHHPIAHHIATGGGARLQRIDSEIAERVMLDLMQRGIVAIPIHDSFLVQNVHEDELSTAMREASTCVLGAPIATELKYPENSPFVFATR